MSQDRSSTPAGIASDRGIDADDLDRLFNLSLDLLGIASPIDGCWKRVNPAMSRTLGWSQAELLATPIAKLVHPDDLAESIRGLARLARGESLIRFEHRLRCKDGQYRWIAWNTTPAPDEALVYCAGRDVTEAHVAHAALLESEARYRSLMNASESGFCVIEVKDEQGAPIDFRFIEVGTDFERLTTLPDPTGQWMRELRPLHEESWYEIFSAVAATGRPVHFQHNAREFDNRWFDVHAFRVGAAEQRRVGVLFNDITERRRTEEALAWELEAMTRLHGLARQVAGCKDLDAILAAVLDATIVLHAAQFGTVQVYDADSATLRIVAHRGFDRSFIERFGSIALEGRSASCCEFALARGARVVIEDVEREPAYAANLDVARTAGYRAVQSTPLYNAAGELLGILSTHFAEPRTLHDREERFTDLYCAQACDAIARHRLEQSLRNSEQRLRLAVEVGRLATWDWNVETGEVSWSDDHFLLQGYAIGEVRPSYEAWASRVHPEDRATAEAAVARARETRTDYTLTLRMQHPDGTTKWCSARGRFFYAPDGRPVRMIGVMLDITARREAEERQRLLIAELQHRTRNLITVIQSIAHETLGESDSLGTFRRHFDDRLAALSRVQGLLARSENRRIRLADVLQMEFAALGSDADRDRLTIEGPEIALPDSMIQTLALALHELATNARKYGAFAGKGGNLHIRWNVLDGEPGRRVLALEWSETGLATEGAAAAAEVPRGFGRNLIERALPYQLQAETDYQIGAGFVRCSIRVPLQKTAEGIGLAQ
ncbi:MAG TPA: PAS domain-containing protein [Steroidobacteraceae bacterium]|nr:PAS domain-containing protein [Steroidobacteraceae bacterium]